MTNTNKQEQTKVGFPGNPCPDCGCQDGNHAAECSVGGFRALDPNDVGLDVLDLQPCLLVAINVSRRGGQSYERKDEQRLEATKDGESRTQWTTKKIIDDQEEFTAASKLQSKAKYAAGKLGRHTPVGIVVAAQKRTEVEQYRNEWRAAFNEFNDGSTYSKVDFSCMVFAIRGDNVQELEQVLEELRNGLGDLENAYKSADPGAIRDVVRRMSGFAEILPERVATKMELAVKAAQKRARVISKAEKRVERVRTKIAQELGPDADQDAVQAELERLSGEALTDDIRKRTARFLTLNSEVLEAADKLESVRDTIDASPIRVARFAVQRRAAPINTDEAVDLNAARLAGRVAHAANSRGAGVATAQDPR